MFLEYTVRQVASVCRTVSEHFSDRVNDLRKAHYFFTEVERMTKHIVTREIRDNKTRELGREYLSRAVTTRWMPGALASARSSCRRCSSNSASTRHLRFLITILLITEVGTTGRDNTKESLKFKKKSKIVMCNYTIFLYRLTVLVYI